MTNKEIREILSLIKNEQLGEDVITIYDKKYLLKKIIDIISWDMRNFKYYDNNDLTYVFTGLKLINELVDSKFLQNLTIKKLEEIHKTVVNHIKRRPEKMDKTSKGRYELLKNIIFKIEDISLKIMYLPISSYDKNKLEFIYYLIFDYKNFDLVKNAIEKYPHLVNLRENGKSLIEYVVENYLMCLKHYLDNY